jgi:hypothetical protein
MRPHPMVSQLAILVAGKGRSLSLLAPACAIASARRRTRERRAGAPTRRPAASVRARCSSRSRASPAANCPGRCWCDLGLCCKLASTRRMPSAAGMAARPHRLARRCVQRCITGRVQQQAGCCVPFAGRRTAVVCWAVVQQPQLTPLPTQLDAEAPSEEAEDREGLLAIALPAMEAALRRAPAALADADSIDVSVVCVRPQPGFLSGALAAVRVLCPCSTTADRAPCLEPWRPRRSSARAGARRLVLWQCDDAMAPGAARVPLQATEQEPDWCSRQRAGCGARGAGAAGGGREQKHSAGRKSAAHDAGQAVRGAVRALRLPHRARGEPQGHRRPQRPGVARCKALCCDCPPSACPRPVLRGAGRSPSQSTLRPCCTRPRSCGPAETRCRRSCCHTPLRSCCPCCFCCLSACARWTCHASACSPAPAWCRSSLKPEWCARSHPLCRPFKKGGCAARRAAE